MGENHGYGIRGRFGHTLFACAAFSLASVVACGAPAGDRETPASRPANALPPRVTPEGGGGFVLRTVRVDGEDWNYQVFVPKGYSPAKAWPVILYLHGNGEKGRDGDLPTRAGLGLVVRARADSFPAIVVFPQSAVGDWPRVHGPYTRVALASLDSTLRQFHVDTTRVYLMGFSYGAVASMELLGEHASRFAAWVPVSQGGYCCTDTHKIPQFRTNTIAWYLPRLRTMPIWIVRGGKDTPETASFARYLAKTLRAAGDPVELRIYPNSGHIVDEGIADPALENWLMAQRLGVAPRPVVHADSVAH